MSTWIPDGQDGYSIALCECADGPHLGARQMGTFCCCERCGRITPDQWQFLVAALRPRARGCRGVGMTIVDLMAQPSGNHEPIEPPDRTATCHTCKRELHEGEAAWADDWKVLHVDGDVCTWRNEARYTCDECEAER